MHRLVPFILVMSTVVCYAQSVYQAEDADVIYHGTVESEHAGYTGSGYLNLDNEVGSYLEWVYLTAKNCVSLDGTVELGDFAIEEKNSWMSEFNVTANDFLSIISSMVNVPRNEDGSLPSIEFMNLAEGSDLIDAGVDVGISYNGDAPDLGAFESNYISSIFILNTISEDYRLYQNYPNPFNPITTIEFQ